MFPSDRSPLKKLSLPTAEKWNDKARKAAGTRCVIYDARHTFARILGHNGLKSVMKYVHPSQSDQDRAMDALSVQTSEPDQNRTEIATRPEDQLKTNELLKQGKYSSDLIPPTVAPARWIDRKFSFDLPISAFPEIVQRLESMPERARAICEPASDRALSLKPGGRWSAKENIGHLDDLSAIDEKRLNDYLSNATCLSPADTTNPVTEAANHNAKSWIEIVERARQNRLHFTRQLAQLTPEHLVRTARHLRLRQQMRLLDWLWFVAEHDDHHLAAARAAISAAQSEQSTLSGI